MGRSRDLPERSNEVRAFLLEPEHSLGHLFADAVPHRLERAATLTLILGFRVLLSVAHQPDAVPHMPHVVQMVFPSGVQYLEQQRSFGLRQFGAEPSIQL